MHPDQKRPKLLLTIFLSGINHIAVVVDDPDAVEVEVEVVSYA
ncbi:hypothetical protein [Profundibacter sp.]